MREPSPAGAGFRPARQRRGQETLERLLEAGEALLDGRDPEEVTVAQIVQGAGASVSSFYARFSNKAAYVQTLHARFCDDRQAHMERAFIIERFDGWALERIAHAVVADYVRFQRVNEGPLRSFAIVESRHPQLQARKEHLDNRMAALIAACLRRADPRLNGEQAGLSLQHALRFVVDAVQAATGDAPRGMTDRRRAEPELVAQLTRSGLARLHAAPQPAEP